MMRSKFELILTTIIISIYSFHANIIKSLMQLLDCREIEPGTSYLYLELSEDCYSERYENWFFVIVIPFFFFYTILVPALSYFYIYLRRETLYNIEVMRKIGFLTMGYNSQNYLW